MLGAMCASFITWTPSNKATHKVNVSYPAMTVTSFYLITKLQAHYDPDFSFFLICLHCVLIVPTVIHLTLTKLEIDGCLLYAPSFCYLLYRQVESGTFVVSNPLPETDCQLSITIDLLCCSIFTIYEISKHNYRWGSAALVFTPLVGPAVVLSAYLTATSAPSLHQSLVAKAQSSLAGWRGGTAGWMNLGFGGWAKKAAKSQCIDSDSFDCACEKLATKLATQVELKKDDTVLTCGCGFGAELNFFKKNYDLFHITGIDVNKNAALQFAPVVENVRLLECSADELFLKFNKRMRFNTVLALDSVYHFPQKSKFLRDAVKLIRENNKEGGRIGVTDIIVKRPLPLWLKITLKLMNVHTSSLWTEDEYNVFFKNELKLTDVKIERVGENVLQHWFPHAFTQYLDYAVLTGSVVIDSRFSHSKRLPKVAVIGSGMSGLTAAHKLIGTHDVTIFEANEKVGLSGQGTNIMGQLVDVPLRIIGQGYYKYLDNLVRSNDVLLRPIRDDFLTQIYYGDNGPKGNYTKFSHNKSYISNIMNMLPNVFDFWKFWNVIYAGEGSLEGETWGDFLSRNGFVDEREGARFISSLVMWCVMGQASWVLSCTYEQVFKYPAKIILNFVKGFGWGGDLWDTILRSSSKCVMMRVHPSMRSLEVALSYGCKIRTGIRVSDVGAGKMVGGEAFDFVIVATEASAIKHILSKNLQIGSVFERIKYQPSHIYLHGDEDIMPEGRENWKAFNIKQSKSEESCQLTVWLNEYYPENKFSCNVFQTWNSFAAPKNVYKRCNFLRVVHSCETESILKEIGELQGANGIFFAGAYSVEGMGLLEQAALSGGNIVERINKLSKLKI